MIEKAEKKYVEARALDKLRIDQIIAENADDREKENQKYLIDEIRLGLCLNYAVFIYEIKMKKKEALRMLKKEIHEALDDYDKWDQESIEQIKH